MVFILPVCPTFSMLSLFSLTRSPSEHQNHAREVVKKADLSQWDALVIMSGDGLLFEVCSFHFYCLLSIVVSHHYDSQYRGFESPTDTFLYVPPL